MVTVAEARYLIQCNLKILGTERIPLAKSGGRVLAHDIMAPFNLPSFRQSAMDGYAVMRHELDSGLRKFKVACEIKAGKSETIILNSGECARIFTGAVVPENADMVVMQEKTESDGQQMNVVEYSSAAKSNIREIGEQIQKGELALHQGHIVTPATIGFLAGFGICEVEVYKQPAVAIIYTGDELKKAGEVLESGEIYESNAMTLEAAIHQVGREVQNTIFVLDDQQATKKAVEKELAFCDALLISGGISVGDHDYVREALLQNGVEEIFYKVKQKPGKPLFFGKKGNQLVFAMPGNPASLLVCFYEYVLPALKALSGEKFELDKVFLPLSHDYEFLGGRAEFLKAKIDNGEVRILEGQASFVMKSFAESDCLVYIYGSPRTFTKGSIVEVHKL